MIASPWRDLRLTDRIRPGVRVLLVGINPGVRSAQTGHHFAGPSNRFWKLLYESGLVPNPSGRNANFTYAEMLAAFRALRRAMGRTRPGRFNAGASAAKRARRTERGGEAPSE